MARKLLTPSNLKAVTLNLGGLDEYIKRLNEAQVDIVEVYTKAVNEIKEGIRADIKAWAESHKETGKVTEAVNASDVFYNGNQIFAYVGIDSRINYEAWHAVFVEYGTPTIPADPKIRQTYELWRQKSKGIFQNYFEEALKK